MNYELRANVLSVICKVLFCMQKKINLFLFFLLIPILAAAQTIPEKYYKKANSPIFLANGFINFSANDQFLGNDSQIYLKTANKSLNGVKYGAVAKLEFNVNSNHHNENLNLDQAFIFSESDSGKFEMGNYKAVNQMMKVGPARFARGAGGINGKYLEQVDMPQIMNCSNSSCANTKLPRFILLAQSPIGHGGYSKGFYKSGVVNDWQTGFKQSQFRAIKDDSFDGLEDATKLNYYSPRIEGLQIAASYTPTTANQGVTAVTAKDLDYIRIENVLSFGANYSNYFNNLGVAFSLTGEQGQVKNSASNLGVQRNNLFSYDLAATLTYFGFSFGASYGTWQKSLQAKNGIYSCDYDSGSTLSAQNCSGNSKGFAKPYYYTLGIAYEFGPIAASLTSINSEFQKNKYQATAFDIDYKLTKNLLPYFEITRFDFTPNQVRASDITDRKIKNNQGYVFLTGILFSF